MVLSPENEYEILQLLMGDLRDRQVAHCALGCAPEKHMRSGLLQGMQVPSLLLGVRRGCEGPSAV